MKEKVIKFITEFVSYIVILTILVFIAHKAGWMGTSIADNVIGLSIGWIVWKVIMILASKLKKSFTKEQCKKD